MRRWREAVAFFYIYKKLYAKSINDKWKSTYRRKHFEKWRIYSKKMMWKLRPYRLEIRISGYQDIRISGYQDIRGCIACHSCATKGKCVFDDVVNELAPKFERIACWNVTCGWSWRNSGRREGLVSC